MRLSRFAVLLVLSAPALPAQAIKLEAELHYTTGGDVWFTTNKPAYAAVFDVSRTGVVQLYPTFSAQASEQTEIDRRVSLRYAATLPPSPVLSGSSLVSLNAVPVSGAGWPHVLLLVTSTSPLRVGNSWTSNIVLNQRLVHEHHYTDVQTDAGIDALVDLVRPLDWGAEVTIDRIDALPSNSLRYASALAYDPNNVALGYSCLDAQMHQFVTATPIIGGNCIGLRNLPATPGTQAAVSASVAAAKGAAAPATPATTAAPSRRAEPKVQGETRVISDPAEIRAFIKAQTAGEQRTHGTRGDGAAFAPAPSAAVNDENRRRSYQQRAQADGGAPASGAWRTERSPSNAASKPLQGAAPAAQPSHQPSPQPAPPSRAAIAPPAPPPPAAGSAPPIKPPMGR